MFFFFSVLRFIWSYMFIILCRLPAFSGINRVASNARGSSNGLANDQQSGENQILSQVTVIAYSALTCLTCLASHCIQLG